MSVKAAKTQTIYEPSLAFKGYYKKPRHQLHFNKDLTSTHLM